MTNNLPQDGPAAIWTAVVATAPTAIVLVDPAGASWSRADVEDVLRRFAAWWQAQPPGPVAVSGIYAPEATLMVLAASWTGRPTLVLPPDLPEADAASLGRSAGVVCHVTTNQMADHDFLAEVASVRPLMAWPEVDPEADALILMSSGTTGAAKLVRLSHRALWVAALRSAVGNGPVRVASATGIHTVTGARFGLLNPALLGGVSMVAGAGPGVAARGGARRPAGGYPHRRARLRTGGAGGRGRARRRSRARGAPPRGCSSSTKRGRRCPPGPWASWC